MDNIELIFSGLLVLFAGATTLFAFYSRKTEKTILKLEAYPKRLDVYDAMQKFVAGVIQKGDTNNDDLITMLCETKHAVFLFHKKDHIVEYIDEFYQKGLKLEYNRKMVDNFPFNRDEKERIQLIEENSKLFKWFTKQHKEIQYRFQKYLSIV